MNESDNFNVPAVVDSFVRCAGCGESKSVKDFYSNKGTVKGRSELCKPCYKLKYHKKVDEAGMIVRSQGEEVRAIAQYMIENPKASMMKCARDLKMRPEVISMHKKNNGFMNAIFRLARNKMVDFVPKAIAGVGDSLESKDSDVKYRSSKDVLVTNGLMGGEKIDITVNDTSHMSVEELTKILERYKPVSQTIVDVEVVK